MFLGTVELRMDEKSRLMIPAGFRKLITESTVVLTKGQERCLYAFPIEEFDRITKAIRNSLMSNRHSRSFSRVFFASASSEKFDNQGRITIPHALRSYASLAGDCAVIGVNSRMEIWNLQRWKTYLAASESDYSATADNIFPDIL